MKLAEQKRCKWHLFLYHVNLLSVKTYGSKGWFNSFKVGNIEVSFGYGDFTINPNP